MRSNLPALALCLIVAIAATLPVGSVLASDTLVWNTFLGDAGSDTPTGVVRDTDGNIYVTGTSDAAWGSPVRAYGKFEDAFVAKFDTDGNRMWVTFLGGVGSDISEGIALSANDKSVYASGVSYATWGDPLRSYAGDSDAYVVKLDAITGELLWNTFIGGDAFDYGASIAASGTSYVYLAENSDVTWGSPVRAYTAGGDAVVTKLDEQDGSIVWNTFLGGLGLDQALAITTDASGVVYVTGGTQLSGMTTPSWGTPVRPFAQGRDAFVARLDPDTGMLVWSTFLGGAGSDEGKAIAVDAIGNVFVAGSSSDTWGSPNQAHASAQLEFDGFAASLSANTGVLAWNTFMGGTKEDIVRGIAVDAIGGVYLAGESAATWGSPAVAYSGNYDAFAARLEANTGVRTWHSFLGGGNNDLGYGVASDAIGNLDVVGFSYGTWGSPVNAYVGSFDGFVARLNPDFVYSDGFESS